MGERSTTIPMSGYKEKIMVQIQNIYSIRSTAQITKGAGEIPLNGKSIPLTGYAEGEEIVCSYTKV